MMSLTGLVDKVKNAFRPSKLPILCKHVYKENGQVWDRISKKQFQLKNRHTCTTCKDNRLETIGEK